MTGLFAGSFDPFTVGHASVLSRVLPLFSHVVVGVGGNAAKPGQASPFERVENIRKLYAGDPKVEVVAYEGLTAELASKVGASYIIKGVRNSADFESEREQAIINRRLSGIDTLLVPAEEGLACVSSSMVRELAFHGRDVSEYLPVKK